MTGALSRGNSPLIPAILNNYFGRQFNSLNDAAVNPNSKELYFTDVNYGFLQDFRPAPVLPNQVYRFNYKTGLVGVVADGFDRPNGGCLSRHSFPSFSCPTCFIPTALKALPCFAIAMPNITGLTFSNDGSKLYVTDTGIAGGFTGYNYTRSAAM